MIVGRGAGRCEDGGSVGPVKEDVDYYSENGCSSS